MTMIPLTWPTFLLERHRRKLEACLIQVPVILGSSIPRWTRVRVVTMTQNLRPYRDPIRQPRSLSDQVNYPVIFIVIFWLLARDRKPSKFRIKSSAMLNSSREYLMAVLRPSSALRTQHSPSQASHRCSITSFHSNWWRTIYSHSI